MPIVRRVVISNDAVSDTAGLIGSTPEGAAPIPVVATVPAPRNPLPLGDYTERLLSSVGITKERYADAKAALGMAPRCGCQSRQDWLNKAGAWLAVKVGVGADS
jgi:hypothetical protein